MNRPVKSACFAAGFLILLLFGLTGQAYADKKPKFVYVANSGSAKGESVRTFNVNATAVCSSYPCASTISISGSFTVDLRTGQAISGTMSLIDTSDLNDSPLGLPFNLQGSFAPAPNEYLFFRKPGGSPPVSYVELIFPFLVFPADYSGGPVCTQGVPACAVISGAGIGGADMSPALYAATANCCLHGDTGILSSGLVTLASGSQDGDSVSGYAVDPTTGALTPVPGSPFSAGSGPHSIVLDPLRRFVFVANRISNDISVYTVDSTTGALTPVPGSPFAAGTDPYSLAIDPRSRFVYVANQASNNVSAYILDSDSGALSPVSGSPFAAGTGPVLARVDSTGEFIYLANSGSNDISAYKIDRTTGALNAVPGSPFAAGAEPASLAIESLSTEPFKRFEPEAETNEDR